MSAPVTPLPWEVSAPWSTAERHIVSAVPIPQGPQMGKKPLVCLTLLNGDASFAVRACNEHYALLAALEDLCSFETELTQEKWDVARAAIARAKGEA